MFVFLIALAWAQAASALAEWAFRWLVNRTDAWGQYRPPHLRDGERNKALTVRGLLTRGHLAAHFAGQLPGQPMGLHAIGPQGDCRWIGIDLDNHKSYPAVAEANARYCCVIVQRLQGLGYSPVVADSDGGGGLHVLVFFKTPIPSRKAYDLAKWLVRDWDESGMAEPETFPRQAELTTEHPFGNWLRLPGRHHTRDHWTRIAVGQRWAEGFDAIRLLLAKGGDEGGFPAEPSTSIISLPPATLPHSDAPRSLLVESHGPLARVLALLSSVSESGKGYSARCPAHADGNPSLSISAGDDGRVLLCCHAGCDTRSILAKLGLRFADLYGPGFTNRSERVAAIATPPKAEIDWNGLANHYQHAFMDEHLSALASGLGLPAWALQKFPLGWDHAAGAWTIFEVDHARQVIGIQRRWSDGRKQVLAGGHRGLVLPQHWADVPGPLLIAEGFSDTAALVASGAAAIGRPSAAKGTEILARVLAGVDREIIVVGDNDPCPGGNFPGRDGANQVAVQLGKALGRQVAVTFPTGHKDVREMLIHQAQHESSR